MTERRPRTPEKEPTKVKTPQPPRVQEPFNNPRFEYLFGAGTRKEFNVTLARVSRAQVHNPRSWEDIQPLIAYLVADYRDPAAYNRTLVRDLYIAARTALLDSPRNAEAALAEYESRKKVLLEPLSDKAFKHHSKFASLFEKGPFRDIFK